MNTTFTKCKIKQTLLSHQNTLRTYGMKRLGLFGYYVKNTAHSESDIDLLVELEEVSFDPIYGAPHFSRGPISEED